MRIPKKVKIGAYDIKITLNNKVIVENDEKDGCYDQKTQTIEIRKGASSQRKRVVLVHELLHAIFDIHNIPLDQGEEKIVENLDHALVSFLKNNNYI